MAARLERAKGVAVCESLYGMRPRTGFTRGYIQAPCWGEEGADVRGFGTGGTFG